MWGKSVEDNQWGGQYGACVSIRESHKGSAPLDGGEGGKVTCGMKELGCSQGPQHDWSPGHTEATWGKQVEGGWAE